MSIINKKLVVASANEHKIKEIKDILGSEFEIVPMHEIGFVADVEETGETFEENSFIKAKAIFDFCRLPSIADDSGLEVDALGNAPGVYSARYAGEEHNDALNRKKLLAELEGVKDRKARFRTVITLIDEFGEVYKGFGATEGEILTEERGENGFGYDSLFFSYDLKKSFGEATAEEKNEVSHRSRALADLIKTLWYYKK